MCRMITAQRVLSLPDVALNDFSNIKTNVLVARYFHMIKVSWQLPK